MTFPESTPPFTARRLLSLSGFLLALPLLGGSAPAQSLINGGVVNGFISVPGEQDAYTFSATAGEGFQIQMADVNVTTLDPLMQLYAPGGALLQTSFSSLATAITGTAATTGTYTLVAGDGNVGATETGEYNIYFTLAPGANEGGALINGGVISDTIDLGDLDSYTFAATAGEGFQIQMADVNATALDPLMRLYDPSGTLLQTSFSSLATAIVRTAATTGTYTLVVSDGNVTPTGTGDYDLYFTLAPGANEGGALINGGVISDTIDLGDLDSYTFTATAGEGFQIQMADVNATALDPLMRLYDPGGTLLQTSFSSLATAIVRTAATTGTYTLVVSDGNVTPTGTGDYDLYFCLKPGANEGGTLINGGVISGTIDIGDLDTYTFPATAGEGFQIQLADVNLTAFDPLMRLYDPSGTLVQTAFSSVATAINRTAATTGTYTLVVSDGNVTPTGTGDYDLYFTLAPGASEGGALVNGGVVSDTIDLGDLDSYTFEATAGENFQIQMADVDLTALDPLMRLYNPSGTLVQTAFSSVATAINRTAASTGTYTLVVSDGNVTPTGTGDYDVHFCRMPGANEGGSLTNGGVLAGTIDLGDLDSFTFAATAGQVIDLQMTDVDLTSLDPLMRLYDPAGALLQTAFGANSASIVRTAASTGTHTVVLSDGNVTPTGTGDYNLSFARDLETYCTPGTSENGCMATMSALGDPSASAGVGFVITATGAEGEKDGLFFFGSNGRQANSWGNGTSYQCVVPPVKRGGLLDSVGTSGQCDGSFSQDLNLLWAVSPPKNPGAGAVVQAQLWYRDPQNTSNQTTSLSDAIEFTVAP